MRTKSALLLASILTVLPSLRAQTAEESGMMFFNEQRQPNVRKEIYIPNVNGYQVVKADFHMHTVFSDGQVWPSIRIDEAFREGLNAMAFTEHVEAHRYKDDVKTDIERSYEVSKEDASANNLTLIKGAEISRMTPPGHFNAIFVGDTKDYIRHRELNNFEEDKQAILKASQQGAFIFWNHPGWKANSIEGSYEWLPFIQELVAKKAINGIEVFNGFGFHKKALDWCIDNNITVMGTSDIHHLTHLQYDVDKEYIHRTMTLVLAKSSKAEDIREALDHQRTIAWAGKYLAGKEDNVKALFNACVSLKPSHYSVASKKGNETKHYILTNNSDLYFEIQLEGTNQKRVTLYPMSSVVLSAPSSTSAATLKVTTAYVRSDKNLEVSLPLN